MLKHDCKECGKRLSETAATCPNCGAPKPPEGWRQVKAPARGLAIAALVFVFLVAGYGLFGGHRPSADNSAPSTAAVSVVKPDAATETAHADRNLPAPAIAIKPGMHFDLRRGGVVACSSLTALRNVWTYSHEKNDDKLDKLIIDLRDQNNSHGDGDFCLSRTLMKHKYVIDDVAVTKLNEMVGTNQGLLVAEFHIIDEASESPSNHYFAILSLVKPWELLAPTPTNPNTKPSDIRIYQDFTVNNKDFIACKKIENLVKISRYIANGDKDNVRRMLNNADESANCFDNTEIFPDENLRTSDFVHDAGKQEAVVEFGRPDSPDYGHGHYYTSIKFVTPPSTSSAAN